VSSYGAEDIFVAAYSSSGDLLWVNSAGGALTDAGLALVVEKSGSILVTGGFRGVRLSMIASLSTAAPPIFLSRDMMAPPAKISAFGVMVRLLMTKARVLRFAQRTRLF